MLRVLVFGVVLFAQAPAPVTVLRAAVGPSGQMRNGDYVLDEERTSFDPTKDKQVVVLFQWQGVPGKHRMSVQWKSPDGASSATPPVEYTAADRRFGGYWPLTLSVSTALGMWSVEATVDGQPAGRLTFDVGSVGGTTAPVKPTRQLMTQPQLFARISAASVVLERATAKGHRLSPAAAVALGHGLLVTSMAAVDGADSITAVLPDARRQPIASVIAMNRAQDWIVLSGGPEGDLDQPAAADATIQVGDRCFSIDAAAGAKVLVDGAVTGRATMPGGGLLVVNLNAGSAVPGSAVFSEYGELMGLVGGSLVSGASDLSDLIYFRAALHGAPVVPIAAARSATGSAPVPFTDAWTRGDILHALEGREHVVSGGFARSILKDSTVHPGDQRQELSARDKEFVVFITWGPQARLKGLSTLRMYDGANKLALESKPAKLDVRPGVPSVLSSWKVPIPTRPGMYRADVLIDGTPIWRGFVRVTE